MLPEHTQPTRLPGTSPARALLPGTVGAAKLRAGLTHPAPGSQGPGEGGTEPACSCLCPIFGPLAVEGHGLVDARTGLGEAGWRPHQAWRAEPGWTGRQTGLQPWMVGQVCVCTLAANEGLQVGAASVDGRSKETAPQGETGLAFLPLGGWSWEPPKELKPEGLFGEDGKGLSSWSNWESTGLCFFPTLELPSAHTHQHTYKHR